MAALQAILENVIIRGVNGPFFSNNNIGSPQAPPSLFDLLKDHINHTVAYNSVERQHEHVSTCKEDTRKDVLTTIEEWAQKDDEYPVCWLYGPAGSGKSTIAHTIAQQYGANKKLAFSYFFSQRNPDRSDMTKLFTTFAYQLSCCLSSLKQTMPDPSKDDHEQIRAIPHTRLEDQCKKLIVDPLNRYVSTTGTSLASPMIIVIDGLDEYDQNSGKISLEEIIRVLIGSSLLAKNPDTARRTFNVHTQIRSQPVNSVLSDSDTSRDQNTRVTLHSAMEASSMTLRYGGVTILQRDISARQRDNKDFGIVEGRPDRLSTQMTTRNNK